MNNDFNNNESNNINNDHNHNILNDKNNVVGASMCDSITHGTDMSKKVPTDLNFRSGMEVLWIAALRKRRFSRRMRMSGWKAGSRSICAVALIARSIRIQIGWWSTGVCATGLRLREPRQFQPRPRAQYCAGCLSVAAHWGSHNSSHSFCESFLV